MKIIIVGAGEVGCYLARHFSSGGHDVCLVERSEPMARAQQDRLDVRVIYGSGSVAHILREAGADGCDLFLAVTRDDSTNLVAALLARRMGARRTVARVHAAVLRDESVFDYRRAFRLDLMFSSERLAAVELAKHIRNPDQPVVEEIARGRIELQQFPLRADSLACGKPLREIGFPDRVRVGWIRRAERNIVPAADETLQEGDLLTVFGEVELMDKYVRRLRTGHSRPGRRSVVIAGGGEIALALAQMLTACGFDVRVIEADAERVAELAYLLPRVTVIHADPTSLEALREERVGECDCFVAAMPDDEDNLMTCLQAGNMGAPDCLTVVQREDYADAIGTAATIIGIRAAVSPREAVRRDLMRFVTAKRYHVLVRLEGGAQVIHFAVRADSPMAGVPVSQLELPVGVVLVAHIHETDARVPAAGDTFSAGDTVYALVEDAALDRFSRILRHGPGV